MTYDSISSITIIITCLLLFCCYMNNFMTQLEVIKTSNLELFFEITNFVAGLVIITTLYDASTNRLGNALEALIFLILIYFEAFYFTRKCMKANSLSAGFILCFSILLKVDGAS